MKVLKQIIAFFYLYSEIWVAKVLYMRRWRFMPDWLPGFRVHNILQSDDDRALHDHPFSFLTVILKGGYYEYLSDYSKKWHGAPAILWRPATTLHRIELLEEHHRGGGWEGVPTFTTKLMPAWTLVFRSRYFRPWGFMTKSGWVDARQFITKREGHHEDKGGQL